MLYRLFLLLKRRYEPTFTKEETDAALSAYADPSRRKGNLVMLTGKEHRVIHSL